MQLRLAILLFLTALPDTSVVPVLKDLFVDRYGVSAPWAQVFLGVNLPGAILALPLLGALRRRWRPHAVLACACAADALLLAAMWPPIGFFPTLVVRLVEGVTDVLAFAVLFDAVRRHAGGRLGLRMGVASTALTFGLAAGIAGGGLAARFGGAVAVFPVSAAISLAVALLAWRNPRWLDDERPDHELEALDSDADAAASGARAVARMTPAMMMTFADRATGGVVTATLPLMLGMFLGYGPAARGALVGLPLALMALGTAPAGWLADRWGRLAVRVVAGVLYAAALAITPWAGSTPWLLALTLTCIGLAGAALLASSLAVAASSGSGSLAMGGFRAAGDMGFFAGTMLSAALAAALSAENPGLADYGAVILAFASFHLLANLAACAAAWAMGRQP